MDHRRSGMKQRPGRQEATEDRPPEGLDPRRVVQRPPTQVRGGPTLNAEQEPPEARTAKDRSQEAKDRESRAGGETVLQFKRRATIRSPGQTPPEAINPVGGENPPRHRKQDWKRRSHQGPEHPGAFRSKIR